MEAIFTPAIFPLNIAELASAISNASPAASIGKPAASASKVNSLKGLSPTAIKIVSQVKVFSVPFTGWKFLSNSAIVILSTVSSPLAQRMVWEV